MTREVIIDVQIYRITGFLLILGLLFSVPVNVKADDDADVGLNLEEISAKDRHGKSLNYFDSDRFGNITYTR